MIWRSKTNIFLLLSFILAISLTGWIYYQMSHNIGELSANSNIDGDFEVCDEDKIPNYYAVGTSYEGGKRAIKTEILKDLQALAFDQPGLISFRFIVNCRGEIGRIRHRSTDLDLQETNIDSGNLEEMESAIARLDKWNPAKNQHKTYDSYYLLNFKVRDGRIVDIF